MLHVRRQRKAFGRANKSKGATSEIIEARANRFAKIKRKAVMNFDDIKPKAMAIVAPCTPKAIEAPCEPKATVAPSGPKAIVAPPPALIADWDFESKAAFVMLDGAKLFSMTPVRPLHPNKGQSSPVVADFSIAGEVKEVKVGAVWWAIVSADGGVASTSAAPSSAAPVHRSFGDRKKAEDRKMYNSGPRSEPETLIIPIRPRIGFPILLRYSLPNPTPPPFHSIPPHSMPPPTQTTLPTPNP